MRARLGKLYFPLTWINKDNEEEILSVLISFVTRGGYSGLRVTSNSLNYATVYTSVAEAASPDSAVKNILILVSN